MQHSLHQRVEAYCYALERLVIAFPSPMAMECEQTLNGLALAFDRMPPPPRKQVSK